ncbi:hypothetical protein SAMN06265795_101299 [Noviherbaspirillum humi]|uniref:Uncharacterized protein n=1 Tax=Noviherbaspirillum humi TaxID=1688639 RepID=A0A239C7G4_9BURK|nr:hypothetical protein [Noviherbaspirillum humi]SNS16050.1 hypothetical protein SAMN06265795_101299 [Noviherbaspirillum humi]
MPTRFVIVCLLLTLAGCANQQPPPAMPAAAPAPAPAPRAEDEQAQAILAAFREDIAACQAFTAAAKGDPGFIDAFLAEDRRRAQPTAAFLAQSPKASDPAYRYVLSHQHYLDIGVDYHGMPWAASWVEGQAIYCAPTFRRLDEIEALGETGAGWEVRRFFLDKALAGLGRPTDPIADGRLDDRTFESLVQDAARRYRGPLQPAFRSWLQQAVARLEQQRQDSPGADRRSARASQSAVGRRIAFLRGLHPAMESSGF